MKKLKDVLQKYNDHYDINILNRAEAGLQITYYEFKNYFELQIRSNILGITKINYLLDIKNANENLKPINKFKHGIKLFEFTSYEKV